MAKKFYAVKIGKTPGVYLSWDECKEMVHGFPGAIYKSFPTEEEAYAFAGIPMKALTAEGNQTEKGQPKEVQIENQPEAKFEAYAFVDGSFNPVTGVYGYGGFLCYGNEREELQGCGNEVEMAAMRNVAGEVLGAEAATRKAIELGLKELVIYYDYLGIEMWATGQWKRNKLGTIAYHEYMNSVKDQIAVKFVKVKAHTGIDGNEMADQLAKEAVGIL